MPESPKRILIVDDEPLIRSILRRLLRRKGYTTFEAESNASALRLFMKEQPLHALLCDVYVGPDSGWMLAKRIHAEQPTIRVVMLTGSQAPSPPQLPFHHAVLLKPFDQEELVRAIEDIDAKA